MNHSLNRLLGYRKIFYPLRIGLLLPKSCWQQFGGSCCKFDRVVSLVGLFYLQLGDDQNYLARLANYKRV